MLVFLAAPLHAAGHGRVIKHKVGEAARAAWVFVPDAPRPKQAPVVIFMHGYRALDPHDYGGWIEHLVARGNVVIYPIYEHTRRDGRQQLLEQAVAGIRHALDYLDAHGVMADRQRFAVTGHSMGGGMAVLLAARSQTYGLPAIPAVMPVQPGSKGGQGFPREVFAELPADLMLLVIEGDRDQFEDSRMGRAMVTGSRLVPETQKRFIILQSDDTANPPRLADHYAPLSPHPEYRLEPVSDRKQRRQDFVKKVMRIRDGEIDVLDTRVMWPLFDALMDAAFADQKDIRRVLESVGDNGGLWRDVPSSMVIIKEDSR
jgi:acetyl esterase/lipase